MRWTDIISKEILDLGIQLAEAADKAREKAVIYPQQSQIFSALDLTPPDKVKACIVGQDPYPNGEATGLAFSTNGRVAIPPSLRGIFKELKDDLGLEGNNGDLSKQAERGVLLLNTTVTVEAGYPNSHANWGWDEFTTAILQAVTKLEQPVVFALWGKSAQSLFPQLTTTAVTMYSDNPIKRENRIKKAYLFSSHPSPLSINRPCGGTPPFRGSRPFSAINNYLIQMGGTAIDWDLNN